MRLNLASGTHPTDLPGWVNIDLPVGAVIAPHVYGNALQLPFSDASFDGAYLGHVLEHLTWDDELVAVLAEIRRVLRPDSEVAVVGPDIDKAVETGQPAWLLRQIDTLGAGPDNHKWVATEALTLDCLRAAGFTCEGVDVREIKPPAWPNPVQDPWQFAITAIRPPSARS